MKPALYRLALPVLFFILGCRTAPLPAASSSASPPAGVGSHALGRQAATPDNGAAAPAGYFASPAGSATGDGSIGDPWDLQTALNGGYPSNSVKAGDTIYLRGGTYTGQFACSLNGTAENYITFRNYPGERATIDGNYNDSVFGNANDTFHPTGSYLVFRDIEICNSHTDRYNPYIGSNPPINRGQAIFMDTDHGKVINCIIHDTLEGIASYDAAHGAEIYGNLIYHNGVSSPLAEPFASAAIDLIPAGGTPGALADSVSHGGAYTDTATWSHTTTTGDYLVVIVNAMHQTPATMSATYNGVSMTLIQGFMAAKDDGTPNYSPPSIGVFGLAGPATGTHDVVISSTSETVLRGVAQSFVNVHQTTPPTASGGVSDVGTNTLPAPRVNHVSSAANHMVVDGATMYANGSGYRVYGDNTAIYMGSASAGSQLFAMSYAAGAASVNMGWDWTPGIDYHGHGIYCNEITGPGKLLSDNIIYDQLGDNCIQAYGSSASAFKNSTVVGNLMVFKGLVLGGGGGGFLLTNTTAHDNYHALGGSEYIGYKCDDLTGFSFINNYMKGNAAKPMKTSAQPEIAMTGNTFIGKQDFTAADYPGNTYYATPSTPASNVVVVRPNAYESNRCNIYVYNWENLTTVDADISSAVAPGTAIYIMNAQDYYNTPVWSGTYGGGTVALPMTRLTAAAGIGYTAYGPTGQSFNAFIVRAQAQETWRTISNGPSRVQPEKLIHPNP